MRRITSTSAITTTYSSLRQAPTETSLRSETFPEATPFALGTGILTRAGVAVDGTGKIYTMAGNAICVYRAGATGNVAPIRVISGDRTKLNLPLNLALDANDNLYVTNYTRYDTGTYVTVYPAGAKGNHKPVQTIQGPATLLNGHPPAGIAVR